MADTPVETPSSPTHNGQTTLDSRVIVLRQEEAPLDALTPKAVAAEDVFASIYGAGKFKEGSDILEPPYSFATLKRLVQENNALSPCIEAMVTNIDGTGFDIEGENADDTVNESAVEAVKDFFTMPWPGVSFTTIRKQLRRDLESMGNAYLEGVRNIKGELVFIRHVEAETVRMLSLDAPKLVEKQIMRGGQLIKSKVFLRERRYVQHVGGKFIFFKEFGSTNQLDMHSGRWASKGEEIPFEKRAGELLQFTAVPDSATPYGVPRWISQLPSVLGSRKAEEHNLSFFDSGGVPPVLILVQGGTLAEPAIKALKEEFLTGADKSRATILEASSTSGDLDKGGGVRVHVERFGAERQQDSMFEKYDENAEKRVRRAFRLPPLFVGQATDYSFATAFASYTVAEAQVFQPEREEFDEIITMQLLPSIPGSEGLIFTSMPLTVKDVETQLRGIELISDDVDKQSRLDTINEITNLSLKPAEDMDEEEEEGPEALGDDVPGAVPETPQLTVVPGGQGQGVPTPVPAAKAANNAAYMLAEEVANLIISGDRGAEFDKSMSLVWGLPPVEKEVFKGALAVNLHGYNIYDPQGTADLAMATLSALADNPRVSDA